MCVYHESARVDRCLQRAWVICLHYTTGAQPPRTIIYSDLPKHTHPETGSMLAAKTAGAGPRLQHVMAFLGSSDAIQHPNTGPPQQRPVPSPRPSPFVCIYVNRPEKQLFITEKLALIPLMERRGVLRRSPRLTRGQADSALTALRRGDETQRARLLSVFANRVVLKSRKYGDTCF